MEENIKNIADALKLIVRMYNTITHPILIWDWLMSILYWLATITTVVCIIYYAGTRSHKPVGTAT